jgi:hypothetical protein
MLERLKRVLVKGFVGAIGLGWLFAQGILHFAYVFSAPVAGWISRCGYHGLADRATISTSFSLQDALPDSLRSFSLLLVAYVLLRWLYYKPLAPETTTEPHSEQSA